MTKRRIFTAALFCILVGDPKAFAADEVAAAPEVSVILVHGAFMDARAWRTVIPLLTAKGVRVTAPTLPLTSLEEDAAVVARAIDSEPGQVLLVGHSWGGAVITQAGVDDQVVGLVYVAAIAPAAGQSTESLLSKFPPAPASANITSDASANLRISAAGMCRDFAQDLPAGHCAQMAQDQRVIAQRSFEAPASVAAWKNVPAWYVVAENDRALSPELQREMARNIGATTVSVSSSHAVMLSAPERIAQVILSALSTAVD